MMPRICAIVPSFDHHRVVASVSGGFATSAARLRHR